MAEITTRAPKANRKITIDYNYGSSLAEAIELFGEELVFSIYEDAMRVKVQAPVRGMLSNGTADEEIQKAMASWHPGQTVRAKRDPKETVKALFAGMSPEEKKAFIGELKGLA